MAQRAESEHAADPRPQQASVPDKARRFAKATLGGIIWPVRAICRWGVASNGVFLDPEPVSKQCTESTVAPRAKSALTMAQ